MLLVMISFLVFVRQVFVKHQRKKFNALIGINVLITIIGVVSLLLGPFDLQWTQGLSGLTLNALSIMYVVDLAVVLVYVGCLAVRSNTEARILMIGLPLGILLTIRDAAWALGLIPGESTVAHWEVLYFVLSLMAILIHRYALVHQRLRTYSTQLATNARETSMLVMDLHDGVGAATANISALSEVAARETAPGLTQSILKTIAGLAKQGQDDIRSYMHSLKQDHEDWSTVVADIRRYGASTLEPHNIDFQFLYTGSDNTPAASVFFSMNVFLIYKEALTNVVKHSGASSVIVNVDVTTDALILGVQDDGCGDQANADPARAHRGLGNMAARAKRLGGQLNVVTIPGFSITATIPWVDPAISPCALD
jgi:signal transduction histidine kinase